VEPLTVIISFDTGGQARGLIERTNVDAVFPDAMCLGKVSMGDHCIGPIKADQSKPATLSPRADLLGIKAPSPHPLQSLGDLPDHGGLTNSRAPRHKQNVSAPI